MRSYTLINGLSLVLPSFALVAYQPCLTTTALPMVTVKGGPDGYYTEYTRTYREFCPQGLTKKIYTVTQTCSDIDCQTPPIETAPPPGFTAAVVKCSACGGQGTQVATLTFPTESVEAYSSSGYVVEPLNSVQATKAWVDHVNAPPATETVNVNGDAGMNAEDVSRIPGSSDHTGSEPQNPQEPQAPSNGGSQQDQNGNGSLGDTSSHHAATEHAGSTSGDNSSDGQNPESLDGTSSAKEWQSGETGNNPGSGSAAGDTTEGSIPQQGSSSPSSSDDTTGPQGQGENTPGHSNDPTGKTPEDSPVSGIASVDGEPITNTNKKPGDTVDTTSPDGVNSASGDTSASADNNSGPPLSQNNSPPVVDSNPKQTGNDDDTPEPDAPFIVSGAGSFKLNISACIIANAASLLIVWFL